MNIIITEKTLKLPYGLEKTNCKVYNQQQFLKESSELNGVDICGPIYVDVDTIDFSIIQAFDRYKENGIDVNFYQSSLIKYNLKENK